jgi:hypothetical protein
VLLRANVRGSRRKSGKQAKGFVLNDQNAQNAPVGQIAVPLIDRLVPSVVDSIVVLVLIVANGLNGPGFRKKSGRQSVMLNVLLRVNARGSRKRNGRRSAALNAKVAPVHGFHRKNGRPKKMPNAQRVGQTEAQIAARIEAQIEVDFAGMIAVRLARVAASVGVDSIVIVTTVVQIVVPLAADLAAEADSAMSAAAGPLIVAQPVQATTVHGFRKKSGTHNVQLVVNKPGIVLRSVRVEIGRHSDQAETVRVEIGAVLIAAVLIGAVLIAALGQVVSHAGLVAGTAVRSAVIVRRSVTVRRSAVDLVMVDLVMVVDSAVIPDLIVATDHSVRQVGAMAALVEAPVDHQVIVRPSVVAVTVHQVTVHQVTVHQAAVRAVLVQVVQVGLTEMPVLVETEISRVPTAMSLAA